MKLVIFMDLSHTQKDVLMFFLITKTLAERSAPLGVKRSLNGILSTALNFLRLVIYKDVEEIINEV